MEPPAMVRPVHTEERYVTRGAIDRDGRLNNDVRPYYTQIKTSDNRYPSCYWEQKTVADTL